MLTLLLFPPLPSLYPPLPPSTPPPSQFTWGSLFAQGAPNTTALTAELEYQLQRISHHPSIVLFDACNECNGGGLYESFVMPTVASIDMSRPIWPSCPSSGWISGVDRLSSRPNNMTLLVGSSADPPRPPGFPFSLESHGPYIGLGGGHVRAGHPGEGARTSTDVEAALCGTRLWLGGCDTFAPLATSGQPSITGPQHESWYKSEFGIVSWPSFESMSASLPSDQWSVHSSAAFYRNWPVDNVILSYFGGDIHDLDAHGETAFKRQLYQVSNGV